MVEKGGELNMAKFLMLGKYSLEAIKEISAERTKKAAVVIEKAGGKINSMYALLGDYDLAIVVDFPGISQVMRISVDLAKMLGISFTTFPAVTVEEFDKMMG
jgi:uncharacterized protein with GYD domain